MNDPNLAGDRACVLAVDDEAVVLDLISEILALDGYHVQKAHSAEAALKLLKSRDFDVVISDFRMPKMSGATFFDRATRLRPGIGRRFVFTSGEMDPESKGQFIKETGVQVIAKPFEVDEVRRIVQRIVESRGRKSE